MNEFYKQSVYDRWNMTEEQALKEAKKIKATGFRLSLNEKMFLLFEAKEFGLDLTDEEAKIKEIKSWRELDEEVKQDDKNIKKMAKNAEDYAVKVVGWNRREFKSIYNMYETLKGDYERALDYWDAYGENGGKYYFQTYV